MPLSDHYGPDEVTERSRPISVVPSRPMGELKGWVSFLLDGASIMLGGVTLAAANDVFGQAHATAYTAAAGLLAAGFAKMSASPFLRPRKRAKMFPPPAPPPSV